MAKLSITLACGDYDRAKALADGTVAPEEFDAFEMSNVRVGIEEIPEGKAFALKYSLAWLQAYLEEERDIFGPDPFPYGLEPNRKILETLIRYEYEQGLIDKKMPVESLFAQSTGEG